MLSPFNIKLKKVRKKKFHFYWQLLNSENSKKSSKVKPKSELMNKSKDKFNATIKLNHVPSNYRNYISGQVLSHSKTMLFPSYFDSHLNLSKNNLNNTNNEFYNKENISNNSIYQALNVLNNSNWRFTSSNNVNDFNLKLNPTKLNEMNKKKSLTNIKGKYKSKIFNGLQINNNQKSVLMKSSSYAKFKNKLVKDKTCKNNYNSFFLRSKSNLNILKYKNKDSPLKAKLANLMSDIKNEINNMNLKSNKIFKEKNKTKKINIINIKERDIKKFNDFAISKVMDINDIKKQNKSDYFDYYYNRNNNKKKRKENVNNIKFIKIIPRNIQYYEKNKNIDYLFEYLK